ncbi:MAG TPA: ATP-binding protein [Candidatus Saccharimonadales bacterium]|nr:ATP-binding protein [Candidatus Saccharimonadales bacterium]
MYNKPIGIRKSTKASPRKKKSNRASEVTEARDKEHLRLVVEAAGLATCIWDLQSDAITWGGNATQIFGPKQRLPENLAEFELLIHPKDRKRARLELQRSKKGAAAYSSEFRLEWPDGTLHWIKGNGRVFRNQKMSQFLGVFVEIKSRKLESIFLRMQGDLEKQVHSRTEELGKAIRALRAEARERQHLEKSRQELVRLLVNAEEEERRRISRELHDHTGQYLTAMGLELNALRQKFGAGPEADEKISRLQTLAKNVGVEVHRIAVALRPTSLDDFGLYRSLLNCLRDFGEATGVAVDHHISGVEGLVLTDQLQTTIYRFLQEALNNVMKHSSATRVSFVLDAKPDHILGIVEDNGKGFSMEKHFGYSHLQRRLGLRGMKERIMLLGGDFQMESMPGEGTTVFVRIPVPKGTLSEREND